MDKKRVAVVGSGPSAIASIWTLIDQGFQPTVFETGLQEEDLYRKKEDKLSLSRKLLFGSNLPYRSFPHGPQIFQGNTKALASFCRGGFSLVWGATFLPFLKQAFSDWPVTFDEYSRWYKYIGEKIPHSDTIDFNRDYETFPYLENNNSIQTSPRFVELIKNSKSNKILQLNLSRLAIEGSFLNKDGCIYCNNCIQGCPFGFIWNSEKEITKLELELKIKVIKARVLKIDHSHDNLSLDLIGIDGKNFSSEKFDIVYVGAGPIETFRILATSKIVNSEQILKDSATFFIPFYSSKKLPKPSEYSHALSQAYTNVHFANESNPAHIQFYDYSNDLISRAKKISKFFIFIPNSLLEKILRNMCVTIGYLDGKDSPSIKMSLDKDKNVSLHANLNKKNISLRTSLINEIILSLRKNLKSLGLLPLKFAVKIADPGEGVHYGAWLPMGKSSSTLGVPNGFANIYIVDSSVLSSIPSGPITFTIMANSARITYQSLVTPIVRTESKK